MDPNPAQNHPPKASATLRSIGERYWAALLQSTTLAALGQNGIGTLGGPLYATTVGERAWDDRLDDLSPEAHARLLAELRGLHAEALALPEEAVAGEELLSLRVLRGQLAAALDAEVCGAELWSVDPQHGPALQLALTAAGYALDSAASVRALLQRYAQARRYFGQHADNLRRGVARGLTAARANVERQLALLDRLIAAGPDAPPFLPAEEKLRDPGARAELRGVIESSVLAGLRELRSVLQAEVLPAARDHDRIGLWALPGGAEAYAFQVRVHAGPTRTAAELHQLGLEQLAAVAVEAEQAALAAGAPRQADGRVDVRAFRASLLRQPGQLKQTSDELLDFNRALLGRTLAALPRAFAGLPEAPLEVRAVEPYRAPTFANACYQPATPDGAQGAVYYFNTWQPETRPLYNIEAIFFHEAVPGHHLQDIAARQLAGMPPWRRELGPTAYVEGWALYAERLADETLHLYSGPEARLGMLNLRAFRAARLVVDTGMHALRWSRQRCIDFLLEQTAVTRAEAETEIDRYAATPGQALGYLVGALEIERLRAVAQARLGDRFDLREFHAAVLRHGAVPLAVLEQIVGDWTSRKSAGG